MVDWGLNAGRDLASLVEHIHTGTASGAGTSRDTIPANAQGEEKFILGRVLLSELRGQHRATGSDCHRRRAIDGSMKRLMMFQATVR